MIVWIRYLRILLVTIVSLGLLLKIRRGLDFDEITADVASRVQLPVPSRDQVIRPLQGSHED